MGARAYNPGEARFLSADPVPGGCANAYTYSFGDPLNHGDLSGQAACQDQSDELSASCSASFWTLSVSCKIVIGPKKAAQLAHMFTTLAAAVGPSVAASIVCGYITAPLAVAVPGPPQVKLGVVTAAAALCGGLEAAGQWQLGTWLQQGADSNQYANIEAGIGILSKPYVRVYHASGYPCT